MGSLTLKVHTWDVMSRLREEFMVPAADAGDLARVAALRLELAKIKERVTFGDTKIYSEELGCWIEVISD